MATVNKVNKKEKYILSLTKKEIVALQFVLWNVGGSGPGRDACSDISTAIEETAFNLYDSENDEIDTSDYFTYECNELSWVEDKKLPVDEIVFK